MGKTRLLAAMGIFGTIGIFVRYIPLTSAAVALARAVMGLLFLGVVMLLFGKKPDLAAIRRNLPLLLLSGAAIGFNWVLLFESYQHTTVATATVCYYLAPLLFVLVSPMLGEKLTARKLVYVGVALAGLVCVSGITLSGIPDLSELKGVLFGIGAAVLYASVMFMNKKFTPISAYDKTVLQLGSAALVLLPYVLLTQPAVLPEMPPLPWILLVVLGIVHTGVAYTLYFSAISRLNTQTVAVFSYLDPAVAILLSALVLREPMTPIHILGTVLILGSALYSQIGE